MDKITIYTDGACSGNPGPGGWAAILISAEHQKEICGHDPQTTNNRMELTAAIEALRALKRPCKVTLYSDSSYLIKCFNEGWLDSWKRNGWKRLRKSGKRVIFEPVLNVDLWQELDRLLQIHRVKWEKVKGHAGDAYNERVDELAVEQTKIAKGNARLMKTIPTGSALKSAVLIVLLLASFDRSLRAQQALLTGSIKDSYTDSPLDSALVEIISTANGRRDSVYTDQNGEWRFSVTTSVSEELGGIPPHVYLLPNSPNPFHPPTQLRLAIPRPGQVEIAVYNLLGQKLDAMNVHLDGGEYIVPWAGKGGPGILFYTVTFAGERVTGKMMQLSSGSAGLGNIVRAKQAPPMSSPAKVAQKEFMFIASKFFYEPDTLTKMISGDTRIDFVLETVHRRALVIDLHNDVLEKVVETGYQLGPRHTINHSDIPRFRDGGLDVQLFSIWIDPDTYRTNPYQQALKFFEAFDHQIILNPSDLMQVRSLAELEQAQAAGKIAGIPVIEGGYTIENSLEKLEDLHARGARYMTITWNKSSRNGPNWAISADDPRSATVGLSDFGRQVIRTMDSLGMIIDVSHTGIKTIEDILTVTRNPIIASHSGARALCNHTRNLYDDQIRKIANSGGVIGVVFYPYFLTASSRAKVDDVVRHIDYIVKLVGVDYVAIGSDFDGIEVVPVGLEDVSKLPRLTEVLMARGYSRAEVRKILGENFLRVFRQVCK